ncbi:APC family permease [Castellaniella sp.]|uniref:APC family permease n=1 Tax=Castellaniella sp. TaxID=1955812 RepID=UPI003C7944B2
MSTSTPQQEADDQQLVRLGYRPVFARTMSLWENFALGFTYLSPVVGVYTLFAVSLAVGGPPFIWSYLLVGIGQFLVCLVFCEVVSQYPISGGVYSWIKRMQGQRLAFMGGWIYLWALAATVAAVAVGAAPYVVALVGSDGGPGTVTWTALALIALGLLLNLGGTRVLATAAFLGFTAELLGALAVGSYLLLFERLQSPAIIFDTLGAAEPDGYLAAFLVAGLAGIFQYYGFEACGDVAEEVPDPSRRIPRAMRLTIYVGGSVAIFTCLSLLLAVPDIQAVISGHDADPVMTILNRSFGSVGAGLVIMIILVSFLSCIVSLQAATSRLLFAMARDRMVPGHGGFARLSERSRAPANALFACTAATVGIVLIGHVREDALIAIISFAAVGIYIAFQLTVAVVLAARIRGAAPSGAFTLGRWGWPVTVGALAYGIAAILNIAWPRAPELAWYLNHGVAFSTAVVIVSGLIFSIASRDTRAALGAGE